MSILLNGIGLVDTSNNPISIHRKIFVFDGVKDIGKTYVISLLCRYLKYKYQGFYHAFQRQVDPNNGPEDEFRFIFNSPKGIIGITSEGDTAKVLKPDLEFLADSVKCDIIICAGRPDKPITHRTIADVASRWHYSIHNIDMNIITRMCPPMEKEIAAFDMAVNVF